MSTKAPYTESDALYATRRALMQALVAVPISLQVIIGGLQFDSLTTPDRIAVIIAVLLAGIGLAASDSEFGLWVMSFAFVPLILLPAMQPSQGPVWLATTTHLAYTAMLLILLLPRVWGALLPPLSAGYLAWVWSLEPQNMLPGGLGVAGGWIQITQTCGISATMWLFWHPLRRAAEASDRRSDARREATQRAELVRQRSILWRQTAVHLHESLLNSIRYVMRASQIDGARLRSQLSTEPEVPEPEALPEASLRQVIDALMIDAEIWGIKATVDQVPAVRFSVPVYEALRAAVTELVRNAVVHGEATAFEGRFLSAEDRLTVSVRSNQRAMPPESRSTGLGTSLVLDTVLPAAGGSWRRHTDGFGFDVEVPIESVRRNQPFRPFDSGRLLISAPLAGITVVGTGYYWLLLAENRYQVLAGLLGIAGVVFLARRIVRQQRQDALSGLLTMLLPAMVPWLVQQDADFCADIALITPALQIAGFTVVAVSLWAPRWTGVVGFWVWGIGALAMLPQADGACAVTLRLPVTTVMFVMPILVFATYRSVRAYDRSRATADRVRDEEMRARAKAAVANEIDSSLRKELTQARSALFELADGAEFTPDRRRQLALLDARIRTALQVRPDEAGILVRTAAFMVEQATSNGIVVRVRSLSDSHDMRPVPLPLYQLLLQAVLGSGDVEPAVQVFTDGVQEFLTLQGSVAGFVAAGLEPGSSQVFDPFTVQVDEVDEGSDEITLVVSRTLLSAPAVS